MLYQIHLTCCFLEPMTLKESWMTHLNEFYAKTGYWLNSDNWFSAARDVWKNKYFERERKPLESNQRRLNRIYPWPLRFIKIKQAHRQVGGITVRGRKLEFRLEPGFDGFCIISRPRYSSLASKKFEYCLQK